MAVNLSALRAGLSAFTPRNTPDTNFCYMLSRPLDHNAAGIIRSFKESNYLIETRTSVLPACSIVPQQTTLMRAPAVKTSWLMKPFL
jgi:hypothetical protein